MRIALNPSAMRDMCPSKIPIASDGESWNRWLAHGKGYGLKGYVDTQTELQPVELRRPIAERPLFDTPSVYCQRRCFSLASNWFAQRSHSASIVLPAWRSSSFPEKLASVTSLAFSESSAVSTLFASLRSIVPASLIRM